MKMIEYLYIALLVISLGLIYLALDKYYTTKQLLNNGIKTKAKVIQLIPISSDDGYTYKPVFEYTDKTNTIKTFKSGVSSNPAPYKVGDMVTIVYSKIGEQRRVISYWGLYRWTIILLSIAAPFLIISGGYFLYKMG